MIDAGIMLVMALFAVLIIHSRLLRLSVIYLMMFSMFGALLYLRHAAPELAIAEAAIGCGLIPLLYLAALKRNRVYTIGVVHAGRVDRLVDGYINRIEHSKALREIRAFFVRREFEVQVVFIPETLEEALRSPAYDLVLQEDDQGIAAYTDDESYVMLELEMMFQMHGTASAIRFVRYGEAEG